MLQVNGVGLVRVVCFEVCVCVMFAGMLVCGILNLMFVQCGFHL